MNCRSEIRDDRTLSESRAVGRDVRPREPCRSTGREQFHADAHPCYSHSGALTLAHGEYLSFTLGREEYGINILKVQEIRGYEEPTQLANAPPFIKGVMSLRENIVPIVDMRIRFNLESSEYNQFTVVIILNVADRVVGMVVDSVSDVIQLSGDQVRPAPDFSSTFDTKYITGLGTVDERMLILVDIERLMSGHDMALIGRETMQ